ncbi:MAG: hypothetical protein ACOCUH_04000, partial [Bacteriovoracia bacterium]
GILEHKVQLFKELQEKGQEYSPNSNDVGFQLKQLQEKYENLLKSNILFKQNTVVRKERMEKEINALKKDIICLREGNNCQVMHQQLLVKNGFPTTDTNSKELKNQAAKFLETEISKKEQQMQSWDDRIESEEKRLEQVKNRVEELKKEVG